MKQLLLMSARLGLFHLLLFCSSTTVAACFTKMMLLMSYILFHSTFIHIAPHHYASHLEALHIVR